MTSEGALKQDRFTLKDGDIEINFATVDGMGLPPFQPADSTDGYTERIRDILNLQCRPDDVLLATYPKCGTHWTFEILNMLLRGKADYDKNSKVAAMLEAVPNLGIVEALPSPRVLNLHLPYKWFPKSHIENGGKIVHATRNPKDAYVSYYHHAKSTLELGLKTKNMTWNQFFDMCVIGKAVTYGTWFDYEREMSQAKKCNKNIYTVHFEKLKEDPIREIKNLANFLEVKVTDDLVDAIAEKCSFQNLKKATTEVKSFPPEMMKKFIEVMQKNPGMELPNIFRKGIVGDWKNTFTVAQNERFDAWYNEEMKDIDIEVLFGN